MKPHPIKHSHAAAWAMALVIVVLASLVLPPLATHRRHPAKMHVANNITANLWYLRAASHSANHFVYP